MTDIEAIAAEVHNSWWDEKKKQGFHPPIECQSEGARAMRNQEGVSHGHNQFPKSHKFCDKCHKDMYPYKDLPENIKEYDRVTVRTVLKAMEKTNAER